MDRGAWWAAVHEITEKSDVTEHAHVHYTVMHFIKINYNSGVYIFHLCVNCIYI